MKDNIMIGLAIACTLIGFYFGWLKQAQVTAKEIAKCKDAYIVGQNEAIQSHNALINAVQIVGDNYAEKIKAVTASERSAYDKRLRDTTKRLEARYATDAADCASARTASSMCFKLLGELDEMAGQFAGYADKTQVAAQACNAAWQKMSKFDTAQRETSK